MAFNGLFKLTVQYIDNEWVIVFKYFGEKSYNAIVRFSAAMQNALGVPHETMVYCGQTASSMIGNLHPKRAFERDNSFNEIRFQLKFNYYPTSKSLVENLNEQCVEAMYKIAALQFSEQEFENVFKFNEDGQ